MYERILVPVDGSATSMRGLEEAVRVAQLTHARLRLIHVVDELPLAMSAGTVSSYADGLLASRERGEAVLEDAQARADAAGIPADTVLRDTLQGRVCELVIKEADSWHADLIVIGSHGRRGARRAVMGSNAEQILRVAPVPVLVVRGAPGER